MFWQIFTGVIMAEISVIVYFIWLYILVPNLARAANWSENKSDNISRGLILFFVLTITFICCLVGYTVAGSSYAITMIIMYAIMPIVGGSGAKNKIAKELA